MNTETIYAILVGLTIGITLGLLKTWLLWYRNNPFKPQKSGNEPGVQGILSRSIFSYFINIIILVLVYLIATLINLPLMPLLLTAATSLILCGLLYPLHNMMRK